MRKVRPDRQKAKALQSVAQQTYKRLSQTNSSLYPTNTVIDYYEIIRKLIEAICCLEGVKFEGEGAHKQSIEHICKRKKVLESERIFLQQLREYRNRINYEGLFVSEEYILRNKKRIESIIRKLNQSIKKSNLPNP